MRVLVTNDDGVDAAGLHAIRSALAESFDSVITVAPEDDCSGFARKCTFARPVGVTRVQGGAHPVYRCDGTPADCVRAGLLGGLAAGADLVVSGINHGANLADDVTYSGTVGAGLEAAILGTPAVCLSQQTPTGSLAVSYDEDLTGAGLAWDFTDAAGHGAALAACVVGAAPAEPVVLSVNYPARRPFGSSVLTRAGRRDYPRSEVPEFGADGDMRELWLFGEPDEVIPYADASFGTDIGALRAGHVSVTPLSFAVELSDLSAKFRTFLARLTATFPLG
ncbi:MAG: 5'/3'-nucleotidase SurE [Streptosporangiaceae bacterium]